MPIGSFTIAISEATPEQYQLQLVGAAVVVGMVLLLIALVIGLDLGLVRVARIVG